MAGIISCEVLEHNVWLVFSAILACCVGCWVQISLYQRGLQATRLRKLGWQFLGGKAAGLSIWCTHFLAILAYRPDFPFGIDPTLTILSALIAVAGAAASFFVAMRKLPRYAAALGGALLGASVSAMHYFGMMAYRPEGLVVWTPALVALSVAVAVGLGAASLHVATHVRRRSRRHAVILLSFAILGLHFIGMAAFRVAPLRLSVPDSDGGAYGALAMAVVGVTALVISAALVSYLLDSDLRAESSTRLREMAMRDPLTGLPNRASFRAHLFRALDAAASEGGAVALIAVDLREFKEFNDQYGQAAGDDLLRLFAQRLRALTGENESAARLGGDEFAIVRKASDPAALNELLDRLSVALKERVQLGAYSGPLGASAGVAVFPYDAPDLETLINNAALALRRAKAERSERACFYESAMDERVRARRKRATELRMAIARDRLAVHYQKQACVEDGSTQGFEALARWPLPGGGYVPPVEFIPLAEECGFIDELGEWVLRTACREAVAWTPPFKVAVNVSPLQLAKPDLAERVADILRETGLAPQRLELELTESAVVRDPERSLATIRAIKALGVSIALDDFGTGHSSLSILRKFPFDKIKLDRSFLWEIETDKQAKAILRAVLALSRSLAIPVLAEGIETEVQLQMLREEACNQAQGYFLGRPAPMATLVSLGQLGVASPDMRGAA